MKKAKEYFYGSLDTELITTEENTYRIAKGGLIDKALEIAYLEGILSITSQREVSTSGYSFKDYCASNEVGARNRIKELNKIKE